MPGAINSLEVLSCSLYFSCRIPLHEVMASDKIENPAVDPFNDDLTHCIIPDFLYLGSCRSASSKSELQKLGITHILNCTGSTFKNLYPQLFK